MARLGKLAGAMTDADSAKLARLVTLLREIGVGPRSYRRVVVFSERIATLKWLAEVVPPLLGFTDGSAVRRMDGTCSDIEQTHGYHPRVNRPRQELAVAKLVC